MYAFALTRVSGQSNNTYNLLSLFNPLGSGQRVNVEHAQMTVYAVTATIIATPFHLTRTTAASSGTLQANSTICKFRTTDPNTVAEIRTGDPVCTLGADIWNFGPPMQTATPGAYNPVPQMATFPAHWDRIELAPGEGMVFRQSDQGDSDQRLNFVIAWSETLV